MKNATISRTRQSETVAHQDLIDALDPNYQYTQDEICDLLHDSPRTAVRDTLHALVAKGVIWRDATTSRVRYALLEGESLRESGRTQDDAQRNAGLDAQEPRGI